MQAKYAAIISQAQSIVSETDEHLAAMNQASATVDSISSTVRTAAVSQSGQKLSQRMSEWVDDFNNVKAQIQQVNTAAQQLIRQAQSDDSAAAGAA